MFHCVFFTDKRIAHSRVDCSFPQLFSSKSWKLHAPHQCNEAASKATGTHSKTGVTFSICLDFVYLNQLHISFCQSAGTALVPLRFSSEALDRFFNLWLKTSRNQAVYMPVERYTRSAMGRGKSKDFSLFIFQLYTVQFFFDFCQHSILLRLGKEKKSDLIGGPEI